MWAQFMAVVQAEKVEIPFQAIVHQGIGPNGLMIDDDFYNNYAGGVHVGVHHEIQILLPKVWESGDQSKIHIHRSRKDSSLPRYFVCYPPKIADLAKAEEVFKIWILGTAFTLLTGRDFQEIYTGENANLRNFQEILRRDYNITLKKFEMMR